MRFLEFLRKPRRNRPSAPNPFAEPDYAGRLLTLNPEKRRTFQCGGFYLGPRLLCSVVPEGASMGPIHRALQNGELIDITDQSQGTKAGGTVLSSIEEADTGKRAFFVTAENGMRTLVIPKSKEDQQFIEEQLDRGKARIELPPGMDDPEKYLLKIPEVT